jgi:type VI secretion system secreted protein Hcp
VRDLEVTRRLDKASPLFELAVCEGKHYPDASLSVRKTGAGAVEYLKFSFKDVVITSLAQSANAAEGTVTETITVNFNEFKTDYTAQKADGSVDGVVSAGWNMAQNKPA